MKYNPKEMADAWADHCEKLATPSVDSDYDKNLRHYVEGSFTDVYDQSYQNNNTFLKDSFTVAEVDSVVRSLHNRKAGGLDGCDPEHYKYAGQSLVFILTCIFNSGNMK